MVKIPRANSLSYGSALSWNRVHGADRYEVAAIKFCLLSFRVAVLFFFFKKSFLLSIQLVPQALFAHSSFSLQREYGRKEQRMLALLQCKN